MCGLGGGGPAEGGAEPGCGGDAAPQLPGEPPDAPRGPPRPLPAPDVHVPLPNGCHVSNDTGRVNYVTIAFEMNSTL